MDDDRSVAPAYIVKRSRRAADGCWLWTGWIQPNGYGRFTITRNRRRTSHYAHRAAYEALRGPIPDGAVLDHLCRNRACCNPAHVEAVTQRTNLLRGACRWGSRRARAWAGAQS